MTTFYQPEIAMAAIAKHLNALMQDAPEEISLQANLTTQIGGRRANLHIAQEATNLQIIAAHLQNACFEQTEEITPPTPTEVADVLIGKLANAIETTRSPHKERLKERRARIITVRPFLPAVT